MKNFAAFAIVLVLIIGGIWWSKSSRENNPDIISTSGIHWHPIIEIYVKGEKRVIPSNIGIGTQYASYPTYDPGMRMTAIHTHEDANQGIIHFEFSGIVRQGDIILDQFLKIWGKDINSFGQNVKMTVNGVESSQLGDYVMQDKDKIVLTYE